MHKRDFWAGFISNSGDPSAMSAGIALLVSEYPWSNGDARSLQAVLCCVRIFWFAQLGERRDVARSPVPWIASLRSDVAYHALPVCSASSRSDVAYHALPAQHTTPARRATWHIIVICDSGSRATYD